MAAADVLNTAAMVALLRGGGGESSSGSDSMEYASPSWPSCVNQGLSILLRFDV